MLKYFKQFSDYIQRKRHGGCHDSFKAEFLGALLPGAKVLEVGCNKRPKIDKDEYGVIYHGIDPDTDLIGVNLGDSFDYFEVTTLEGYNSEKKYDLIILDTVLEHVESNEVCFAKLASLLASNGVIITYQPAGLHPFSIINKMLSHNLKMKILKVLRPWAKVGEVTGWPAYYDKCTPGGFRKLAKKNSLIIANADYSYNAADYFTFFPPLFLLMVFYEETLRFLGFKTLCAQFWVKMTPVNALEAKP